MEEQPIERPDMERLFDFFINYLRAIKLDESVIRPIQLEPELELVMF